MKIIKKQDRRPIALIVTSASLVAIFGLIVLPNLGTAEEVPKPQVEFLSADQALTQLKQGNRRCVQGKSEHGHNVEKWRERFLHKQKPFATVLGCSDSRVAPELLFDQGFGELFVIRVAGNIVAPDVIGSIQYAVEHLDNKLIVVLGHQNCGAVTAALAPPEQAKDEPPELRKLLDKIRPAISSVDRQQEQKQRIAAAVEANARASANQLRQVHSIAAAIKTKNVKVVGAVYHIDTGEIMFLGD